MVLTPGMSLMSSIAGFVAVMAWRIREGRTAVTIRKIVIPPLGMATGFCMFIAPAFRVPLVWAAAAFLTGALILAYPILRTSRLTLDGDAVMISVEQTAALFFVLAFGMILRWRASMFFEYRKLTCDEG